MRIRAIDISKLALYGIFLNYYCYYILFGNFIPMGSFIFLGVAVVTALISASRQPIKLDFEIKCWLIYFVYSVLTIVISYSPQHAIDGLVKFFQRIIVIMLITYICEKEKSIIFAIRLLAVTSVACALSSLLMMNDISQKLEMRSGADVSTNDIGSIMAFGCFAILFAFGIKEKSNLYKTLMKVGYILAAVSVIAIAGSRKSILAIIIMFALMFVFCWSDYFKNMNSLQFASILIVGAVVFFVVSNYLLPHLEDTNLYVRMFGRRVEATAESDQSRITLYKEAIDDFVDHFLFGLGFNNYTYLHYSYTHSTYVEPLACSGIFGILYLIPYVRILVYQFKLSFSVDKKFMNDDRLFNKEMLAFYLSFLFVGIGIPFIYKDIPCIILAMFIAWQNISVNKAEVTSLSR